MGLLRLLLLEWLCGYHIKRYQDPIVWWGKPQVRVLVKEGMKGLSLQRMDNNHMFL